MVWLLPCSSWWNYTHHASAWCRTEHCLMLTAQDFMDGQVVAIDKPYGWTSFQATSFVKYRVWKLCGKKIKVGHAGTLDPLATGLVLICTGKKTKSIESIQAGTKTYKASIYLGATTASYDLETPVEKNKSEFTIPSEQDILTAFQQQTGQLEQTPPIFSAKKVNGKRAYESARKNESVELKPNRVHVYSIDLLSYNFPHLDCSITCSKGTYIRSIAHDIGQILGCGALLAALRRVNSGEINIKSALSPQEFALQVQQPR